jgi:hypothetical protein
MQDGGRVLVKRCARCLAQLPLDRFYPRKKNSRRLSSYCNACVAQVSVERRAALRKMQDRRCMEDVYAALARDAPINFAALTRQARIDLLDLLDQPGTAASDLAARVGCSTVTIYRHRRERRDREEDPAGHTRHVPERS